MTTSPNSPKLLKAGLVLVDPESAKVLRIISLQYNPEKLTRSLQVQTAGGEGGNRSEAMRFKGPAVETIRLEAEIDATDQLQWPDQNANAAAFGVAPQLAALESLVNPSVDELLAHDALAASGRLEILPPEAPLVLFVWGAQRVAPVRVTECSFTEEAFDAALNPIRARVSLSLRVLSTDDLGFAHKGGQLFIEHLRKRESLAGKAPASTLAQFGISSLG